LGGVMRGENHHPASPARAHLPCPNDRILSLERRTIRLIVGFFAVVLACSVVEIIRGCAS
jgi:hypothetical protein